MKGLLLIIAIVFATTQLHAKDYWEPYSVICNDDVEEIRAFYRQEGLYPLMAGGGHIPREAGTGPLVKVVTYILQDDSGSFAVMRYDELGNICLISVGGEITTDATLMMEWLGIE